MLAKGLQDMGVDIISCHNRIVCLLKSYERDKKQGSNFKSRSCFSINYMVAEKNNHASDHDNKKAS